MSKLENVGSTLVRWLTLRYPGKDMHAEKVSIIVYFEHVRPFPLYFSPG